MLYRSPSYFKVINVDRTGTTNHILIFLIINQLDALISQIYFRSEILHVSDSSSVHHQEFFTVHTYMTHTTAVFTVKNS